MGRGRTVSSDVTSFSNQMRESSTCSFELQNGLPCLLEAEIYRRLFRLDVSSCFSRDFSATAGDHVRENVIVMVVPKN